MELPILQIQLRNIWEVYESGIEKVSYKYNELSQLIRENNGWQNLTIRYEYDKGGNLTSRKEYAYTTAAAPSSLKHQAAYPYGNSVWKDQLTAYDGTSITYDRMGNPLKCRGMTLT